MPYHVYLRINNEFSNTLVDFYDTLNDNFISGVYKNDIESLQYPPHVTISYSFDEEDSKVLESLKEDLKMIFSVPFNAGPERFKIVKADKDQNFHRITFEWSELSYRVEFLRNKYKNINWQQYDYHITLVNGTSDEVLKMTKNILPKLPKRINFDLVLYEYTINNNAVIYSNLKNWKEIYSVKLV